MRIRTVFSLSLSMIVVGCAIRPLPKNVTRDKTVEIVNKIRCEARDALIEIIKKVLWQTNEKTIRDRNVNLSLLNEIKAGNTSPEFFCKLRKDQVGANASFHFQRFVTNSIAYKFKFDITENKKKSGLLSFSLPFTKGNFSLKMGAGADKSRQNVREFEVADSFSELVTGHDRKDDILACGIQYPTPRNKSRKHWIYPITGKIGLDEFIDTYVQLLNARTGIPSLSDDLKFTTVIDASLNPKVTLSGIPAKKFRLSEADLTYTAKRTDIHQVTLTLTKPAPPTTTKIVPFPGAGAIPGAPPGFALGLAVTNEKPKPSDGIIIPSCSVFVVGPKGPFVTSRQVSAAAKKAAIAESRRRDFINTSKDLRDLVGR